MKQKISFLIPVLALLCIGPPLLVAQEEAASLTDLDAVTAKLAAQINPKLNGKVAVGEFVRGDQNSPLGHYWAENLKAELSNIPGRTYTVLAVQGGESPADYTISGEIAEIGSTARIYTRLIRNSDTSLVNTWYADFTKNEFIDDLLGPIAGSGGRGSSSVRRDRYEPDSRTNALAVEIGAEPVSRTIHSSDQDWFKVISPIDQQISVETEGGMDTFMELYDGVSGPKLQENDDGGSGVNARIRWNAEAGKEYILMVRGFYGETGPYRLKVETFQLPDQSMEPNDTQETATQLPLDSQPVNAAIANYSDVDWYRVEIPEGGGEITVYTRGNLDTLLTLTDADGEDLAEDDDSGSGYNARIVHQVSAGTLYIRVSSYDDRGPYSLHIEFKP